ncbi:E3 SUMO-protein ligase NSE2-like [Asterias amurensis]|uniref:E3 SUMO-protein ligase NSE2-like n=1 Tax=Asterias amurensis TaxID=7602 RepID=UPI003AB1D7CD
MSGIASLQMVDGALRSVDKVQSYITIGMEDIIEVSLDLAEMATEGDDTEGQLLDLKEMMQDYAMMEHDLQQYVKTVKQVKGQVQKLSIDEQMDIEVPDLIEKALNEAQGSSDKAVSHTKIDELKEKLWQYKNAGETMVRSANEVTEDEDVVMTQCEVSTKCPITKCEMVDPVTNKHCQHTYEKTAIMQMLRNRKNALCPVSGCGNKTPLDKTDLVDNRQLKRLINQRNK